MPGFPSMKYFIDSYLCGGDDTISPENKDALCGVAVNNDDIF